MPPFLTSVLGPIFTFGASLINLIIGRGALKNTPAMQVAATAQKRADKQDSNARAAATGNLDEIRKTLSD